MSSYIDTGDKNCIHNGEVTFVPAVHWRDLTFARLVWLYDAKRAYQIISGNDPATQADIARWHSLGERAAA